MSKISKDFIKFRQHIRTLNLSVNEQYLLELFFEFHNTNYGYCFLKVSDILKAFNTTSKNRVSNVIKSLEEKELIIVDREYKNNRYTIIDVNTFLNTTEVKEEPKKAPRVGIDSNGSKALPNQITVEEALQASENKELTLVDSIIETTGCTPEVAQASVEYANEKGANNIKNYAVASIKNSFTGASTSSEANTYRGNYTSNNSKRFNNFEPRDRSQGNVDGNMTYEEIEAQLLGWYNDESEDIEEIQESTSYDFLTKYGIGLSVVN